MAGAAVEVRGKFLYAGERKLYVQGVTYGTFRPDHDGDEFPDPETVERDFRRMAAADVNAIRTYTVPPRWLLDAAAGHGLRVLVGLAVEREIGFLADGGSTAPIVEAVTRGVRACAGHPALLGFALGNEVPASSVRWLGRQRFERLIRELFDAAKRADPSAPVTYANFPPTEYLQLDFLDFVCFNVFLESRSSFDGYLRRLQSIAGDRPLIVGEMGLDSRRHGEDQQAAVLDWQVRGAFAAGCAGAFVYAWTDEWHTGAGEIRDWDFGLVRRDRTPKPAHEVVRAAFGEVPFPSIGTWPRISVVVCSYNGSRTIRETLDGIARLEYPDFEAIVVDDGSTDDTAEIARGYDVRVISTPQSGLSNARNTGLEAATGDIVAYIDDDAAPDEHWLTYLAQAFATADHAAAGGPNINPPGLGLIADCVALAPGNPAHVLLTDDEAEHVPGCNLAIRRSTLVALGGFDPRFRAAGDDVDICWRIRDLGRTIGFSPAAMVWHRRRSSIRAYLKQQRGYGRAEALLEAKWPERYNAAGHVTWGGRVYGAMAPLLRGGGRVYQGVWGRAPFQSLYASEPGRLASLPLIPEWYLLVGVLLVATLLGALWTPLLLAGVLLAGAVFASLAAAFRAASRASLEPHRFGRVERLRRRGLIALLHLLQPAARLLGRVQTGLTPWRRRTPGGWDLPRPRHDRFWSERWQSHETWIRSLRDALAAAGAVVRDGGPYDRFDLEIPGGMSASVRVLMSVEEHGAGRQLVRVRSWPRWSPAGPVLAGVVTLLAVLALASGAATAAIALGIGAVLIFVRAAAEGAAASATLRRALDERVGGRAVALPRPERTDGAA